MSRPTATPPAEERESAPGPDTTAPALAPEAPVRVEADLAAALLLRAGTLAAALLLAVGLVAALLAGRTLRDGGLPLGRLFLLEAELPELLAGAGVLTLCATPILRVAVAAAGFARARDRRHALAAVGVLLLLAAGLAAGAVD